MATGVEVNFKIWSNSSQKILGLLVNKNLAFFKRLAYISFFTYLNRTVKYFPLKKINFETLFMIIPYIFFH